MCFHPFHKDFATSFKAHPLGFEGGNLGFTSKVQKKTKARAIVQQKSKGHVAARLQ
jgi:hypothetical protein